MFTGIIDDVGTIERLTSTDAGREFRVATRYRDLTTGESIAMNGACLTVREHGDGWFTVAAVLTTLGRTTIESWRQSDRVNLERAMQLGDRLGGHLVQGHVDGVGRVTRVSQLGDARLVDVELPNDLGELLVAHGSVTIDGVSLTINALLGSNAVQLSLIEYTLRHTTLGALAVGSRVHVEADVIGKYVRSLLQRSSVIARD